ncbi:MAG: SoxR reducing system RseC family protein [Tissierellia bacterium]|nr:SoxR reducing system RseC family protein [Tissierellia bacterium]
MDQVGKVKNIDGNMATILVKRVSACGDSCASCSAACKQKGIEVDVEVSNDIKVGDYVEINTENEIMLKHILMLYGMPLIILLGTIFIVYYLLDNVSNRDAISAICGLASLIVSFFILKKYDKREMEVNPIKYTVAKKL